MSKPEDHWCQFCGVRANYGFGRDRTKPLLWACGDHRAQAAARLATVTADVAPGAPAPQGRLL